MLSDETGNYTMKISEMDPNSNGGNIFSFPVTTFNYY